MKRHQSLLILCIVLLAQGAMAKNTQSNRTEALSPEEQLKTFKLADGYVIELVASEKDGVINPIDLAFDDAGRLWTQTARMYPLDPAKDIGWNDLLKLMENPEAQQKDPEFKRIVDLYQGKTKGEDKVLILSGLYGSDKVKTSVFADGLAIPQSILPYKNGVYVAQGSEMFFLDDTDGDGAADKRTPLLTGFGFTDTHTMAHTLVRGPGSWIHFSHGALNMGEVTAIKSGAKTRFDYSKIGRFSMDGEKIEVVSSGLNNIWGFWMRSDGSWWGVEANDQGWSVTPMEPGTGFKGIGNRKIRPYQPLFPPLHNFRVGGTGISGLAFSDDLDVGFPADRKDVAFLANPITNAINAVRIVRGEDGSVTAEHLPDLLTCEDDWFRPVNIEFGPDGCLYIADWYNKIVSHNEVARTHPDRDKSHGRIWRIRHLKAAERKVPDLTQLAEGLVERLASPYAWERRAAMQQIVDRDLGKLANHLKQYAADEAAHASTRIHALWTLEGLGQYDSKLMQQLLSSKNSEIRREAVRAMIKLAPDLKTFNAAMTVSVNDSNPMVRSATLRAIAERNEADLATIDVLVDACKPELHGDKLGGPYERKFERYLARMALEQFQAQLNEYFDQPRAVRRKEANLLWASQALPEAQRTKAFLSIWKDKNPEDLLDESTFIVLAQTLKEPAAFDIAIPILQHQAHGAQYVAYAVKNQAEVQSPQLTKLITPAIDRMLQNEGQQMLALDAIAKFRVVVASDTMAKLLEGKFKPELANAVLKALQVDLRANQAVIRTLARNPALDLGVRLSAYHSYAQAAPREAQPDISSLMSSLAADEKRRMVAEFSTSKLGASILLTAHGAKSLELSAFDAASAEKIAQFHKDLPAAAQLLKDVQEQDARTKQEMAVRLKHLMKVTVELKGSPESGKALFNVCLMCHKVGERGFDIAPALDGSAHREKEALLTAILNPDAAVEGGYQLFRVRKTDNTTLEGYRAKDDETGVTIAFMGGATVFIPAKEIASKQFVPGRSFMPAGLINGYSDQNVADLLAFIATLK